MVVGRRCAVLVVVAGMASAACAAGPTSRPSTRTGDVRVHERFHSTILGNDRRVWVYVPPGYEASTRHYPVLYMQDGQNVFDAATSFAGEWEADESAERLIRAGAVRPIIIVGIDNTAARMEEYTPTRDARYGAGGSGDAYVRFVIDEVKPFVDRTYRTRVGREDTAMAGSSLGALISLSAAQKFPETFSRIGLFSPSLQWDEARLLEEVKGADAGLIRRCRYWVSMGTKEGDGAQSEKMMALVRELRGALEKAGLAEGQDFRYVEAEGAIHNESAWARQFPEMLRFFFPRE